jgi:broad specificity phosphatase PhoE
MSGAELLDPANICMVFVSPRQRAHTTFHLLFDHLRDQLPDHVNSELVREWDYGCVSLYQNAALPMNALQ